MRPKSGTPGGGGHEADAGRSASPVSRSPSPGLPPRLAAFRILQAVQRGEPFEQALGRAVTGLPDPDRRLAHELAAGIFRQRSDLDARLQPLVHRGWSSVTPELRDLLRLGAYQLATLDRIPPHAAVATAVDLARRVSGERAARFVNAILRNLGGRASPRPVEADPAGALADRHSHPDWLVRRWLDRYGSAETEGLLEWNNRRPPLVLQPARSTLEELQAACWGAGIASRRAPFDAGLVLDGGRPSELPGYAEGAFYIQDPAQVLVARYASPPENALVYDACAAPGGKALALGRVAARVLAGDAARPRVHRLRENLRRAGSGREFAIVADGQAPPCRGVDLVLVDAPCLGTGTLARHPDARWRARRDALPRLVARQRSLLDGAASAVRPGGWLVYATCSLEPEENEDQVNAFLEDHPDFRRDPPAGFPAALCAGAGDLVLLPQRHGVDGAYAARLRREER